MGEFEHIRLHLIQGDRTHGLEPATVQDCEHDDKSADIANDGHDAARQPVGSLRVFINHVAEQVDGHVPVLLECPGAAQEGRPDENGLGEIKCPDRRMAELAED